MIIRLLFFGLFFVLTVFSRQQLKDLEVALPIDQQQRREVLYLPNAKGIELVSFGYKNVLADLLWFNTINYFGKHYRSDHSYVWLHQMCDLVTTMDPKMDYAYEFCSLMLAWEGENPESAIAVLDQAISSHPDYWRFYYLRGMNYAFFLKNEVQAHNDFVEGAKKPGAPPFLARLATKTLANLSDTKTAIAFLADMIKNSSDPNQKKALTEHLQKLIRELEKEGLSEAKKEDAGS